MNKNPCWLSVEDAAELIRQGGVVAFPSPSSYGLAAHAFDPGALSWLTALKNRGADHPFTLLVSGVKMIEQVALLREPGLQRKLELLKTYPVTVVIPARPELSSSVRGTTGTVAVRFAVHPVELELVNLVGNPVTATSANLSGQPPMNRQQLISWFSEQTNCGVISDGEPWMELSSTIVSLGVSELTLFREGSLSIKDILEILNG